MGHVVSIERQTGRQPQRRLLASCIVNTRTCNNTVRWKSTQHLYDGHTYKTTRNIDTSSQHGNQTKTSLATVESKPESTEPASPLSLPLPLAVPSVEMGGGTQLRLMIPPVAANRVSCSRNKSISLAHCRPSLMAQTTKD
jgi:hypothetical protein